MEIFSKKLLLTGGSDKIEKPIKSSYTSFYLTKAGDLYGCGYGSNGQLGNGKTGNNANEPYFIKIARNVVYVYSSGGTTWYINKNGDLYGCGSGSSGQQGNGSTAALNIFEYKASNVKKVVGPTSGVATYYLTNDGKLFATGDNSSGQQGSGNTTTVTTFTQRASNVKDIYAHQNVVWYIDNNDDLYGCGDSSSGQQGSGGTSDILTFTKRASNVKSVCAEQYSTMYITNTGDMYMCGWGASGGQGSGNTSNVLTFTKRASNVKDGKCTSQISAYLTNSGDLYITGRNAEGQQGSGDTNNVLTFTKRASNVKDFYMTMNNYSHVGYVTNDNDLYLTGTNTDGQQGSGDTNNVLTFTKRASNVKDVALSNGCSFYVTKSGKLFICGWGYFYQQGDGYSAANHKVLTFTQRS